MFTAAALVPSPPLLVPELNGADASATEGLRRAAIDAVRGLGQRWTVIGVGPSDAVVAPREVGTFRGFGADVRVGLSPAAAGDPDTAMPLPALVAGWLRGVAAPDAQVDVRIVAADTAPRRCAEIGAELREHAAGVLVVADGAATLTQKAPGAFHDAAPAFQQQLDAALTSGDCAALAELDPARCAELVVDGRVAWQVLAGMFDAKPSVQTLYCDAPFGVGYYVGLWQR